MKERIDAALYGLGEEPLIELVHELAEYLEGVYHQEFCAHGKDEPYECQNTVMSIIRGDE